MTYQTYRHSGDLEHRIKLALASFHKERGGTWPAAVVVHTSELVAALEVVGGLGIDGLEVRGSGGCLVPEVWLQEADRPVVQRPVFQIQLL
jgi:hypothetical protein